MNPTPRPGAILIAASLFLAAIDPLTAQLQVVAVDPAPGTLRAPRNGAIVIDFDRSVARQSVVAQGTFWAFGRWSGTVPGTITYSRGRRRMTLVPDQVFAAWVVSRFFGGWTIFKNDGQGHFSEAGTIPARQAGSCALLLDIDNDRDLDMALVDEIQDELIILKNDPSGAELDASR